MKNRKVTKNVIKNIITMRKEGKTYRDIGKATGVSRTTVKTVLDENGLVHQEQIQMRNDSIVSMWHKGASMAEISRDIEKSSTVIARVLQDRGIGSEMSRTEKIQRGLNRAVSLGRKRKFTKEQEEKVIEYYKIDMSVKNITEKTGIIPTTFYRILKRNNVKVTRNNGSKSKNK